MLSSFLVAICLLPSASVQAATATEVPAKAEKVAESDEIIMYYDESTAMITLKYKDTGLIVNSKVVDGTSGNKAYKNNQKADFLIDYYKTTKSASPDTVNNYVMAIETDQVETEKIDNGIKIKFTLKEDKLSMDVVPKKISQEKMESMILDNLGEEDKEFVRENYRLYQDYYIRQKDSGVTQSGIKRIRDIFYEKCGYTDADLEADNAQYDYVSEWSNLEIRMTLEYVLEGSDVVVRVPMDEYYCNSEEATLNAFSLLPYFLSSTVEEEGYMVVPDGSGAVINFNNGLTKSVDYVSRVFGTDTLIKASEYDSTEYYANMPILGMVYSDYAYLAIVEKGAAMAEIHTQISGKNDDYNKAYFKFYIQEMENVATMEASTVSVNKFTGDVFNEDIVVRYQMLGKEEANYTGIAKNYQQYLIDTGVLTKNGQNDNASLFLEILGSTKESENFLGIPYQGISSLTTFKEAKAMLEALSAAGIKDMDVQLTGWANGGENHSPLTKVDIDSAMGSKKDLNALAAFAAEKGYSFYPGVNLQTAYAKNSYFSKRSLNSFAGDYAAKFLSMEYAQIGTAKLGLDNLKINELSGYLVSPNFLTKYVEKAMNKLDKFDINGIAVRDMGSLLVADYSTKIPVNRENAAAIENAALGLVAAEYEVLLEAPYSYAWKYVDSVSNLPARSNEYNTFNYDIPLMQLVLDGCVSYSTTPLNYDTQMDNNEMLLKCIETRTNPKFTVMQAKMTDLKYTEEYVDLLSVEFEDWKDNMVAVYDEYNTFYQMVKDAEIESHETPYKNVAKVTYTNGVVVYVNYAKRPYMVDGNLIPASSYLVENN